MRILKFIYSHLVCKGTNTLSNGILLSKIDESTWRHLLPITATPMALLATPELLITNAQFYPDSILDDSIWIKLIRRIRDGQTLYLFPITVTLTVLMATPELPKIQRSKTAEEFIPVKIHFPEMFIILP